MGTDAVAAPAGGGLAVAAPRRRLWELPAEGHGLLVGTCLPAAELRGLTDRLFGGRSSLDDGELLVAAAAQCATRNRVSLALQRALDARHALPVRRFASARHTAELHGLWLAARDGDDFVGAFWAAIGHPHCDGELQQRLCIDLQQRLFALAARVRDDAAELAALQAELHALKVERERLQQRHADWRDEALAARETLRHDERRLQLECVRLSALAERWRARAEALAAEAERRPAASPAPEPPQLPQTRAQAESRPQAGSPPEPAPGPGPVTDATGADAAASAAAASAESAALAASAPAPGSGHAVAAPQGDEGDLPRLEALTVLCVGGHPPCVPAYRALIERQGGRFEHHDGGVEHSAHRLGRQLVAADLVLCQAGSLSHNAYARVKAHCKRRSTPCLYLERPGVAALARALRGRWTGRPRDAAVGRARPAR